MTNAFSQFSLKRNRSASSNKGLNALLNKLTNTFYHHKKRKHKKSDNNERRSSFSVLIDYFRSVDDSNNNNNNNSPRLRNHPFDNDSVFKYKRFIKKQNNNNKNNISNKNNNTTTNEQHHRRKQQQKDKHDSKIIFTDENASINSTRNPPIILVNNKAQKNHRHTNSTISQRHSNKKSRHVRHYSHVSCISTSNITVNSEDLTAKEFADIAGIRILSDDENYATAHSEIGKGDLKTLKKCAVCDELEINGDDNVINNQSSMIVISRVPSTHVDDTSSSSSSSSPSPPLDAEVDDEPQIWDTDFWCPPGTEKSDAVSIHNQTKPPILNELKSNTNNADTIIKKGRFEIHLQPNNNCNTKPSQPKTTQPDVLEWKRKKKSTIQ